MLRKLPRQLLDRLEVRRQSVQSEYLGFQNLDFHP
jgi:hypothetical protein